MTPIIYVKLAFVLDITGSMEQWIHTAKTKICEIVDSVFDEHPHTKIDVALVAYRDYGDRQHFQITDFTSADDVIEALHHLRASGGEDEAEDVAGALKATMDLEWDLHNEHIVRMVVHIADSPAHGVDLHKPSISDRYPSGDPTGLDPRDYINRMCLLGFHYTFIKSTLATDTMTNVFHTTWNQHRERFLVIDLTPWSIGAANPGKYFSEAISITLANAITRHTSSRDM
jgi:hypothetical protein